MDFTPFLTRTDFLAIETGTNPEPLDVNAEEFEDFDLEDMLAMHVNGEERLGTYTPDENGLTRWACIDIDGKGGGHRTGHKDPNKVKEEVCDSLREIGIRYYLERSASGHGWHVWIFYSDLVPAADVRAQLLWICDRYKPKLELFPKRSTAPKEVGNMVWLPWWGRTKYEVTTPDGTPVEDGWLYNDPPPEAGSGDVRRTAPKKSSPGKWNPVNWTIGEAASALEYLDPDLPYDEWSDVLRGLKYAFSEEGKELAEAWSSCGEKWDPEEFNRVWEEYDRVNPDGPSRTHATIIQMAKEEGWVPPSVIKIRKQRYTDEEGEYPAEMAVPSDSSDLSCARAVLENLEWPHGALDGLWAYSEQEGVWVRLEDPDIFEAIEELHGLEINEKSFHLSMKKIKAIKEVMLMCTNAQEDWPTQATGISFRNGFLGAEGLVPHAPEHWARHFIDEDFDEHAVNEVWEQEFLSTTFDEPEAIQCVQEFFGASMMGTAVKREKVLFLKGPGGTGKSTVLDAFGLLFPENSISRTMPQMLKDPKNCNRLFDSRVNIVDDLSGVRFRDAGIFKSVVSGKIIEGRYLYRSAIEFRPQAAWVLAGNRKPDTDDTTTGFFRRWLIIACENKPEVPNLNLSDQILEAGVAGIAAWAYRGFRALEDRGPNSQYTEPNSSQDMIKGWELVNSQIHAFVLDCTLPGLVDEDFVTTKEMYATYKTWKELRDPDGIFRPFNMFVHELGELGILQKSRHLRGGKRGFCCKLRSFKEIQEVDAMSQYSMY